MEGECYKYINRNLDSGKLKLINGKYEDSKDLSYFLVCMCRDYKFCREVLGFIWYLSYERRLD